MRNEKLGKVIFERFERNLSRNDEKSSFDLFAEETASDLVLQSPYVSQHLIARGIIKKGEHTRLVPVWTANLAGQLYGATVNKGHKMTTVTAHKRASTLTGHSLRNFPKINDLLKSRRKSEYDFYYGMRDAALVESLQCDYIAGVKLSKQAETAAGIALLRRLNGEIPDFRDFLEVMDVDHRDMRALRQFAEEGGTRDYIREYYSNSLYFQRRRDFIIGNQTVYDVDDNAIDLKKTREPVFTEGKIAHVVDRLGLNIHSILAKLSAKKAAR